MLDCCLDRCRVSSSAAFCGAAKIVEPGKDGRLCACGQRGCLEAYASASAVAAIASERLGGRLCLPASSSLSADMLSSGETGEGDEPPPFAPSTPTHASPAVSRRKSLMQWSDSPVSLRIMELERRSSSAPGTPIPAHRRGSSSGAIDGGVSVGMKITAADVFAMAKKGDEIAAQVVEETCDYLGLACVNICRILDPDVILLAGGLSRNEGLVEKVRKAFSSRGWSVLPHECEISVATTGAEAGVIGAAGAASCEYALSKRRSRRRLSEGGSIDSAGNEGSTSGKQGGSRWRSFLLGVGVGAVVAGVAAASAFAAFSRDGRHVSVR